jgi:negative regulator of flagellin synthesis FlgM
MEISRQLKTAYTPPGEAAAPARTPEAGKAATGSAGVSQSGDEMPLEQLQEALRSLPDVDLEKVAAIRQALRNGELDSSSSALAISILTYHGVERG